MVKTYKDLIVWQKSYSLCLQIYKLTTDYPIEEKLGLIFQIRKAALSIPSNISEGFGRKTRAQYIYFLNIAYGSLCELESQILISRDLGYLNIEDFKSLEKLMVEIGKMLNVLIKSLRNKK